MKPKTGTSTVAQGSDPDAFARRLETEGLIILPESPFILTLAESSLLDPAHSDGLSKNISLGPGGVRGAKADPPTLAALESLMARYSAWARDTLVALAPRYAPFLDLGRTSLRTREVDEPARSLRKDDRRLHVDAFASQPTGGRRILRLFSNINPHGEARHWRVGESFEAHARRWAPQARRPLPLEAPILQALRITRARRQPYDFLMLAIHDGAKLDVAYQANAAFQEFRFPPGSSWLVYTDSVVHAAMGGRFALEQTFYLPIDAMAAPAHAPLRVLEGMLGRALA
jgi:hypothetical protein